MVKSNGHIPTLPMHENVMSSLKHMAKERSSDAGTVAALRVRLSAASVGPGVWLF